MDDSVRTSTDAPRGSRRRFLQISGGLTAGALAGAAVPHVHAAEDNTIKLAVVGCGGRGTGAVNNALSTTGGPVKLVAMADLYPEKIEARHNALKKRHGAKIDVPEERRFIGFDAYKKAIDCLDPGDVVLLTTHAAFRPLMFEYAVEQGVNVFAEKSFATDGPNVRRWFAAADAAKRKGLKVGVGFMWRHSPARQAVIERIHNGAIGDLHTLRIYRVHGPVNCPRLPAGANEIDFQIRHPNSFTWVSSGFFVDWHCHNVDVACWVKDAWPVEARGMGGRCYESAGSQFDHYTVEYTFADGAKLFAFSRHMQNCWQTYSDYAHGSKGSAIVMTNLSRPLSRIYKSQNMVPEEMTWEFGKREANPYVVEWQVLLDAIRQDKPHNEAHRAGEAEVAALMGRAAVHTGKAVTWDQMLNSDYQFVDDIDGFTFESTPPIRAQETGIYAPPMPGITVEV